MAWAAQAVDWANIALVAFDVDGTLYDQQALRLRMARDMALDAWCRRSLETWAVVGRYRQLREQLCDEESRNFEPELLARTAAATGLSESRVRAVAAEWIDRRPLAYLHTCRRAGVAELFSGLRRQGKAVGIVSDYPATAKLQAMELVADLVVSATDPDVGVLKPHPLGLNRLMQRAGVSPEATLLIGDRVERDGAAALRAGTHCLIRSAKMKRGWQTFARFDDPVFEPMLLG